MNIDFNEIRQIARRLEMPCPGHATVIEIMRTEGAALSRELQDAEGGNQAAANRIRGVFLACHDSTADRLRCGKLSIPPVEVMIAIGKSQGAQFGERVKEWAGAGFPEHDASRYIRRTLARFRITASVSPGSLHAAASEECREAEAPATGMPSILDYRPGRSKLARVLASETPVALQHRSAQAEQAPGPEEYRHTDSRGAYAQHPPHVARNAGRPLGQHQHQQDWCNDARKDAIQPHTVDDHSSRDAAYANQHIYSAHAAVCISADLTRAKVHTVRIEAAESTAARRYDWQHKIAVQLSQRELPLVLAVFMGWLPRFEGKGHGENNSKWFSIENQGSKLFLSVSAKGQPTRAIPILPGDSYAVTTLMLRQLIRNDPILPPAIVLSLVRKEAALAGGRADWPEQRAAA